MNTLVSDRYSATTAPAPSRSLLAEVKVFLVKLAGNYVEAQKAVAQRYRAAQELRQLRRELRVLGTL